MNISVKVEANGFAEAEVATVVADAIRVQAEQAEARRGYFLAECKRFEDIHNMTSDVFLEKFESGELGDDEEWFDWFAAKRGFDNWNRQFQILTRVTI